MEADDAGATRIDRIYRLIEECRFGIHDLSRIERDAVNNLPRFNMPFSWARFLGPPVVDRGLQRDKHWLVREAERYRHRKYLSDIAGQDIRSHDNDPTKAMGVVI